MPHKVKFYFSDTTTSSHRLWVNYTPNDIHDGFTRLHDRFYALDALSCWGGKDKTDRCQDGSITVSWELPAEFMPAIKQMLMAFKGESWEESNFWEEKGKH